jgi:hypothetical protein
MKFVPAFKQVTGLREGYEFKDVLDIMTGTLDSGILVANGLEDDGWQMMSELRARLATDMKNKNVFQLKFVVVKNMCRDFVYMGVDKMMSFDLVQRRKDKYYFWWELPGLKTTEFASARRSANGFMMKCYDTERECIINVMIICKPDEYKGLVEEFQRAGKIRCSGMNIDVQVKTMGHESYVIATEIETMDEDYSVANCVLSKLKDWRQIAPGYHFDSQQFLFGEVATLSILMTVMYYREGSSAFNTVYFGPPSSGKTTTIKILVDTVGGSFEAATAASGKGWLVTHASGVPSKVFTERKIMLVDEFFKAAGTVGAKANYHSYALELNQFLQKHMQLFERRFVDISSGMGTIKGIMKCSFIGTENNDENLQRALMKAEIMSGGPMRRFQFGYIDKMFNEDDEFIVQKDVIQVEREMTREWYRRFGKNVKQGISALFMYSRKFSNDPNLSAPTMWVQEYSKKLFEMVKVSDVRVPAKWRSSSPDAEFDRKILEKVRELIKYQQGCLSACWISAAIIRGWEVHDSLEVLEPVFDDKQKQMAEDVALYLFISRLRVFEPGVQDIVGSMSNVGRG